MSKLSIEAETESDKYDTHTAVLCYDCGGKEVERTTGNVGRRTVVGDRMSNNTVISFRRLSMA